MFDTRVPKIMQCIVPVRVGESLVLYSCLTKGVYCIVPSESSGVVSVLQGSD